jgi:hypothetical protein
VSIAQPEPKETVVDYMTTKEVAELCRTAQETVRYWRHVGKGPRGFKLGRKVLYRRRTLATATVT